MRGKVAVVREQGQDFAVLLVKDAVLSSPQTRDNMLMFGRDHFGVRTALLGEHGRTWGPRDIVNWLRGVAPEQLPWREFWMNN
jgi:hypothetical protein